MSTSENETNNKMHNLMNNEWTVPDINDRDDDDNKKEDLLMCCGATGLCCIVCGIGVGYIVWLVYSIIGMTEISDETLRTDHCGSLLWRYCLTMAIMTWFQVASSKPNQNDSDDVCAKLCGLFITYLTAIGLASWGSYELWGRSCSSTLTNYTIYTTSYIMVVYQWVMVGLLSIIFGTMLIWSCCSCPCSNETATTPDVKKSNEISYNNEV